MGQRTFVDVGELGWTLYLSAHINWLLKLGEDDILVFTDRPAFFPRVKTEPVPRLFYKVFRDFPADCLGRLGVSTGSIKQFFREETGKDITLPSCSRYKEVFDRQKLFLPYPVRSEFGKDAIVIFPRFRDNPHHAVRNLPKEFYYQLTEELSSLGQDVFLVGSKEAYDITYVRENVFNFIGKTLSQDLIDICSNAHVTVGGTSAPPKIALLQGTPSFIIGHEKERFTKEENWSKTEVGFYEIQNYSDFPFENCVQKIKEWMRTV